MIIDRSFERVIYSPVCAGCKHFDFAEAANKHVCAAFPNGIPLEIWEGHNKHTSAFPGDHGITFEPLKN